MISMRLRRCLRAGYRAPRRKCGRRPGVGHHGCGNLQGDRTRLSRGGCARRSRSCSTAITQWLRDLVIVSEDERNKFWGKFDPVRIAKENPDKIDPVAPGDVKRATASGIERAQPAQAA